MPADPTITLDRPGAVLRGATLRGVRINVAADGCTLADLTVLGAPPRPRDAAPAAFLLGAVLGAIVCRWGR